MSRRRAESVSISLFPFLAVLISAMGAMILLLLLVSRQAQQSRDAERREKELLVEPYVPLELGPLPERVKYPELTALPKFKLDPLVKKPLPELPPLRDPRKELAARREQLGAELEKLHAAMDDPSAPKIENKRLAELVAAIEAMRNEAQRMAEERRQQELANRELEKQKRELGDLKRQIDWHEKHVENKYAIVAYTGPNGTSRRPIFLECTGSAIILQPEGVRIPISQLGDARQPNNAVTLMTANVVEYLDRTSGAFNAYPLIIVRPDGIGTYVYTQGALQHLPVPFGYELVNSEVELDFPPPDPKIKEIAEDAVRRAQKGSPVLAQRGGGPVDPSQSRMGRAGGGGYGQGSGGDAPEEELPEIGSSVGSFSDLFDQGPAGRSRTQVVGGERVGPKGYVNFPTRGHPGSGGTSRRTGSGNYGGSDGYGGSGNGYGGNDRKATSGYSNQSMSGGNAGTNSGTSYGRSSQNGQSGPYGQAGQYGQSGNAASGQQASNGGQRPASYGRPQEVLRPARSGNSNATANSEGSQGAGSGSNSGTGTGSGSGEGSGSQKNGDLAATGSGNASGDSGGNNQNGTGNGYGPGGTPGTMDAAGNRGGNGAASNTAMGQSAQPNAPGTTGDASRGGQAAGQFVSGGQTAGQYGSGGNGTGQYGTGANPADLGMGTGRAGDGTGNGSATQYTQFGGSSDGNNQNAMNSTGSNGPGLNATDTTGREGTVGTGPALGNPNGQLGGNPNGIPNENGISTQGTFGDATEMMANGTSYQPTDPNQGPGGIAGPGGPNTEMESYGQSGNGVGSYNQPGGQDAQQGSSGEAMSGSYVSTGAYSADGSSGSYGSMEGAQASGQYSSQGSSQSSSQSSGSPGSYASSGSYDGAASSSSPPSSGSSGSSGSPSGGMPSSPPSIPGINMGAGPSSPSMGQQQVASYSNDAPPSSVSYDRSSNAPERSNVDRFSQESERRGRELSMSGARLTREPIRRTISVECVHSGLILYPGKRFVRMRPGTSHDAAVNEIYRHVADEVRQWGSAGPLHFWQPVVDFKVRPSGVEHYYSLVSEMSNGAVILDRTFVDETTIVDMDELRERTGGRYLDSNLFNSSNFESNGNSRFQR